MHNLYSIFEFKFPIGVEKLSLGNVYSIKIAGISGFIHTPHLSLWLLALPVRILQKTKIGWPWLGIMAVVIRP